MFFLLRTIFWLSIVLALLPSGTSQPKPPAVSVSAVEAVTAAGAAMSDVTQFCSRQPEACDVGAQAAAAFGQRAQAGARMVYDFISDRVVPQEAASAGSTGSGTPATSAAPSTAFRVSRGPTSGSTECPIGQVPPPTGGGRGGGRLQQNAESGNPRIS